MASLETEVINFFSLGIAVLLLGLGIALLLHLRRLGGLELALTTLIASPRYRTLFLGGLVTSLTALFALGFSFSLEQLLGIPAADSAPLQAGLFGVGAAGILELMFVSLRTRSPSLQAVWTLRETAERVSLAATPVGPGAQGPQPRGAPSGGPGRP